jgi:hypothetical protein
MLETDFDESQEGCVCMELSNSTESVISLFSSFLFPKVFTLV